MNQEPQSMYGAPRLEFSSDEQMRAYNEQKYGAGGYEKGVCVRGVNISSYYHGARRAAVLELLQPQPGERLLDAGCGDGGFAAELAGLGCDVDAVDIASNAVPAAFAQAAGIRFQQMNLNALQFPDETFDKIACVEVLEHCRSPAEVLAELKRVLQPQGSLVITYPCLNRTTIRRLGLAPQRPISEHLTELSYDELRRELQQAGLRWERTVGVAFDFGYLMALKHTSQTLARWITRLQLRIHGFHRNSMFVVIHVTKHS